MLFRISARSSSSNTPSIFRRVRASGESTRIVETGTRKRKVDPETRACAAMALGKTGSPKARTVLEKLRKEKEAIVRNAVDKALKELG